MSVDYSIRVITQDGGATPLSRFCDGPGCEQVATEFPDKIVWSASIHAADPGEEDIPEPIVMHSPAYCADCWQRVKAAKNI